MGHTAAKYTAARTGFTLVELSIVLVIIGLLVGGVLAGQSLIRASELNAIITERDKFTTATYSFRDKYFGLPGDMIDAYEFWGDSCGTNTTATSTGCNGNGDGILALNLGESLKAWEHLARSGLIEGAYDGTGDGSVFGGGMINLKKSNIVPSKFPQGFWILIDSTAANHVGEPASGIALQFGGFETSPLLYLQPSLTLGEAFNLDTKTDDGRANTGKIRGYDNTLGTCYDTGTDYYNISSIGENDRGHCTLTFLLQ